MSQPTCRFCTQPHDPDIFCLDRKLAWRKGLGFGVGRVKAWKLLKKMMTLGLEIN